MAGACLAWELTVRGKKVVVFDVPGNNRSSTVAAGLYNPITGKFLKKSWMAEKIFPALTSFYSSVEDKLGEKFFYEIPIYRPFESIEEQNDWMAKSENPILKSFIHEILKSPHWADQVQNPFGGLLIKHSGYLDVNLFLNSVRKFLSDEKQFQEELFSFEDLKISDSGIEYQHWKADKIIFSEGVRSKSNPYFNWVPVKPMKGEVLSIEIEKGPEAIFNRGVYIVPDKGNRYNVGATYQQPPFQEEITAQGKDELVSKLNELLRLPYKVVGQKWGIRPTTPDRKPILGPHPNYKNVIIFNGLGTKGVSLAPYFSTHLAEWIIHGTEIMKEVHIQRFYPLYSGSSL